MKTLREEIIKKIRYLHESKKLSYEQIAKSIGYERSYLVKIRHGKFFPKSQKFGETILEKLENYTQKLKEGEENA